MSSDQLQLLSKQIESQLRLTMREIDQLTRPYLPELVRGQVGAELMTLLTYMQQVLQLSEQ